MRLDVLGKLVFQYTHIGWWEENGIAVRGPFILESAKTWTAPTRRIEDSIPVVLELLSQNPDASVIEGDTLGIWIL